MNKEKVINNLTPKVLSSSGSGPGQVQVRFRSEKVKKAQGLGPELYPKFGSFIWPLAPIHHKLYSTATCSILLSKTFHPLAPNSVTDDFKVGIEPLAPFSPVKISATCSPTRKEL